MQPMRMGGHRGMAPPQMHMIPCEFGVMPKKNNIVVLPRYLQAMLRHPQHAFSGLPNRYNLPNGYSASMANINPSTVSINRNQSINFTAPGGPPITAIVLKKRRKKKPRNRPTADPTVSDGSREKSCTNTVNSSTMSHDEAINHSDPNLESIVGFLFIEF